jgi:hypothetical protein
MKPSMHTITGSERAVPFLLIWGERGRTTPSLALTRPPG